MKTLHVFTLFSTAAAFFDGQYGFLTGNGERIDIAAAEADAAEFNKANGTHFFPITIARTISPVTDLKTIWQLCKLIKKKKYDVVFGHTPKGAMVAMFAGLFSGVKVRIYYRHGLIYTTSAGLRRFILKSVERVTALCATHIVNVSPSLGKLAVKDHLNSDRKQTVIGCGTCGGIDTIGTFNPEKISQNGVSALRHTLGIPDNAFVVGFCGRLCRDKGIIELIEGFKQFQQSHPDVIARLLLVGPYDARDILPQNIKDEIESNPAIISPGRVSHHYLPNYYSLMDVFVFPSYREGFGMTVIEASAMCLPILVSRSHGCVDSIREDATGQYIDITPESIAQGLDSMLDNDLRHRLGQAGRDFVTHNFERTRMWPQILDFYSEILLKTVR